MWIEFQNLNELEQKVRSLAVNLFDVLNTTETKLKSACFPYKRVDNIIIVDPKDYETNKGLEELYQEYLYFNELVFKNLGIGTGNIYVYDKPAKETHTNHPELSPSAPAVVGEPIKRVKKVKE